MSSIFKRFKPWTTPRRYVFTDPDSNRQFESTNSKEELMQAIVKYRRNNGYEEIKGLNAVLENYWCELPENAGLCENYTLERGLMAYLKGTISLIMDALDPTGTRVSQQIAETRALQCTSCKYNVMHHDDELIKKADKVVKTYLGEGTKTSHDKDIGNCGVCSCILRYKVHKLGPFLLPQEQIERMKEVNCWHVEGK